MLPSVKIGSEILQGIVLSPEVKYKFYLVAVGDHWTV